MRRPLYLVGLVACMVGAAAGSASATVPELITVSDTGMEATWSTASAGDTTVCVGVAGADAGILGLGASPTTLRCERQEESTKRHHASVNGLKPGTRYVYELRSAGVVEPTTEASPGSFTTLVPPPGRRLLDIALLSDVHVGEGCSGSVFTAPGIDQSVPECFSSPGYAAKMLEAAVGEINARGVDLTINTADTTSSGKFTETSQARAIFGGLKAPFFVVRGNHERPAQQASETRCGKDNDCFRTVFFPDRGPGRVYYSQDVGGVHFSFLDANDASGQGDLTDAAQNAFLVKDLAAHSKQRTFIVFHEMVAEYSNTYALPPVVFGVRPDKGGAEFLKLVADNPQVSGVLGSHTHRNFVSTSLQSGARTVFLENAASKEYAGGYGIISVYEGGWMRTFQRLGCAFCREWIETTRQEYNGQYAGYSLGSLSARNFVHLDDCDQPTPPNSVPNAQGGDTAPIPPGCGKRSGFPAPPGINDPTAGRPGDAGRPGSGAGSGTGAGSGAGGTSAANTVGACRVGLAPSSSIDRARSRLTAGAVRVIGTTRSRGCVVVRRVQVALALRTRSGCRDLRAHGGFSSARPCTRPVWLNARGTAAWSLRRRLHIPAGSRLHIPAGSYLVRTRARDASGREEQPRRPRVFRRRAA